MGPAVTGSVSQNFKPTLQLEKWFSPDLAWVLKLCGVLPQVLANPQDAQRLPGDCPEPNTTPQRPGWPQHCPGSVKIWGHEAAALGQHAACTWLHPAADRDWCVPVTEPRSLAWCCAPQMLTLLTLARA